MNSTIRELDDNLQKMVVVESLVREAREELQELKRTQPGSTSSLIPGSVWMKVRQALAYSDEVNSFLASLGNQVMLGCAEPIPERTADSVESRVEKTRFKVVDGKVTLTPDVIEVRADDRQFTGAILDVNGGRVAQNIGRGMAVIHDARRLDHVPALGKAVCVMYRRGRGHVVELLVPRGHDQTLGG